MVSVLELYYLPLWKSLYILPGGAIGRRYVNILTDEINYLVSATYPSERVLVFSLVILQCDRMVRKGADIRRLLERCLGLWQQGKFDMLIQEAEHCNQALHWSWHSVVDDETVLRIFTKLMLHSKVKAAVHWATERTIGAVLSPSDLLNDNSTTTVMDILHQEHPAPSSDFPCKTVLHELSKSCKYFPCKTCKILH